MPLRLDVRKKLQTHSDRVKAVDFHPSEPWVLSALYSGMVMIHNYETQSLVKSLEVSQVPIRCAKFVTRKQWIITTGDDMLIRTYNYNTLEKLREFEAHSDYIRHLAIHPTLPFVLSASDDMTVRLWDWEKDWVRIRTFESHTHYVMMVQWNPKDPHIFATASLDRLIKVWGIQATSGTSAQGSTVTTPHFQLEGHERGINALEYSANGEKPYIISGSDDKTVKIWDYQTKQCIVTLKGHTANVSAVSFHPRLPIVLSGAEDGTLRIWHSSTYRLESTLNFHMDRAWAIAIMKGSTSVAVGYDEGTVVVKLGSDRPIATLQGGKIVWAKGSDVQTANLKFLDDGNFSDGERLPLAIKDLGSCDIHPQSVSHHPNGRFVAVCGDGEYIIYTAQALRSKAYGKALELVWSPDGMFAVRDEVKITIFQNFKEHFVLRPPFPVEEIFGGRLLGLRSSDFICFYDWMESRLIRRIEVAPRYVWWNDSGDLVCLACSESFFVLRHDKEVVAAAIAGGAAESEDGIEIAFDLLHEVAEKLDSGVWVGECLTFVTSALRLQTFIAGQVEPLAFLDRPMYLLGYLPEYNKIYLIDTDLSVVSYVLHLALVEYQCAICRKDFEEASTFFALIPSSLHNRVARFLDLQGHKEDALEISTDPDHRFEIALSLGKLQLCASIVKETPMEPPTAPNVSSSINITRWKQLGDVALERGHIDLSIACFKEANDYTGLLLIAVSLGDEQLLRYVADNSFKEKKSNLALLSHLLLGETKACVDTLVESGRLPEAAFFARTYRPSEMSRILKLWKNDVRPVGEQIAKSLVDPEKCPDKFVNLDKALEAQELIEERHRRFGLPPAHQFSKHRELLDIDIVEDMAKLGVEQVKEIFLSTEFTAEMATSSPSSPSSLMNSPVGEELLDLTTS